MPRRSVNTFRHLAWFLLETGQCLGEWSGRLPFPTVPIAGGEARTLALNAWLHEAQRLITPNGSPYPMTAQAWNLKAWDACLPGEAVCLDVTQYQWPVGDFVWSVFDGVDRLLDLRDMRIFLQVVPQTGIIDCYGESGRPMRDTPTKLIADVTGTEFEPWAQQILGGRFVRRDGRIVFDPREGSQIPEPVILALCDRNPDLALLHQLDPARIPLAIEDTTQ